MSLQIWLPLIKDVQNQGICGDILTSSGVVFTNGGKLGEKYLSAGTITIPAKVAKTFFNKNSMSFAFWLYPIGSSGTNIIMGQTPMSAGNNRMYSIFQYSTPNDLHLSWQDETATSTIFLGGAWNGFFQANVWTHCCITYNGNKAIIYRNGEQYAIANGVSNRSVFEYDYPIIGNSLRKLQDVRIYDHCLSPLEVKQISQGLILHYPLNRNGWGQENLLIDTYNWSTLTSSSKTQEGYWYNPGGVSMRYYDEINNITYCKIWHGETSSWTRYCRQYVTMQPNTYYTVSILCKINTSKAHLSIRNDRNSAITSFANNVEITNKNWQWKTFTAITHASTSQEPFTVYAQLNSDEVLSSETSIDIAMIKLEEGAIATPWCPNSADELYSTLGLNDNIQYDTSGYKNNGTKIGTFNYDSNTPKYNVSAIFNGTERIKRNTLDGEIYTLACWAKTTKNKSTSQQIIADSKSEMTISFYNGTIIGVFGTTRGTGSKSTLGSSYKENNWNHFVVVKTGTSGERAIYCNGVLLTPTSNDYWGAASGFFVGARNDSQGNPFYGQICDVRAYATALSAQDVLSLYNNSAYIDNQGNIYGAVYEEV